MRLWETQTVFFRIQSTPNCRENLYSATASTWFELIHPESMKYNFHPFKSLLDTLSLWFSWSEYSNYWGLLVWSARIKRRKWRWRKSNPRFAWGEGVFVTFPQHPRYFTDVKIQVKGSSTPFFNPVKRKLSQPVVCIQMNSENILLKLVPLGDRVQAIIRTSITTLIPNCNCVRMCFPLDSHFEKFEKKIMPSWKIQLYLLASFIHSTGIYSSETSVSLASWWELRFWMQFVSGADGITIDDSARFIQHKRLP